MTAISFLTGECAFAGLWLFLRALVWLRQGRIDWRREALLLLMYVNLAVILRFTFFPMDRVNGQVQPLLFKPAAILPFRVNLIPLVHILRYRNKREMLLNVLGNVFLFLPSGIVLPLVYRRLNCFWKVVVAGAWLSLCIELLQLPFSVRSTDIDDLLLNTLGVVLGYALYALARCLRKKAARKKDTSN